MNLVKKRKKRPFKVNLTQKAKLLGWTLSFMFIMTIFGMCWMFIAGFMGNKLQLLIGLFILGMGAVIVAGAGLLYSDEYNKCVENSVYTTILWNERMDIKHSILQNGHGDVIEIDYLPMKKTFQTSGRYTEKL